MRSFTLLVPGLLAASMACSAPTDPSVWRFRTVRPWLAGNSQALTPVVDRQSAFFCGGYFWDDDAAIHGLSLADGRLLWTHRVGTCRSGPWLLANTLVVHSQPSRNGLDMKTGSERWAAGIGGFEPPTTKDGWLYANGEFSVFVADPATGTVARTIKTQAEVTTTPVLAGDLLLFGTIDGGLHAVRVGPMRR
jgi:hypothetical protein